MDTGDMFEDQEREARIRRHVDDWRETWGWNGPTPGGQCEVDTCVVETDDGGDIYAFCEQVTLIEQRPDGRWLAEMKHQEGEPWPFEDDSYRLVLDITDIGPPRKQLREQNHRRLLEQLDEMGAP